MARASTLYLQVSRDYVERISSKFERRLVVSFNEINRDFLLHVEALLENGTDLDVLRASRAALHSIGWLLANDDAYLAQLIFNELKENRHRLGPSLSSWAMFMGRPQSLA